MQILAACAIINAAGIAHPILVSALKNAPRKRVKKNVRVWSIVPDHMPVITIAVMVVAVAGTGVTGAGQATADGTVTTATMVTTTTAEVDINTDGNIFAIS